MPRRPGTCATAECREIVTELVADQLATLQPEVRAGGVRRGPAARSQAWQSAGALKGESR